MRCTNVIVSIYLEAFLVVSYYGLWIICRIHPARELNSIVNFLVECWYLRSAFVAGGFLVAQFVLIDLDPNHCPFIAVIALSASCKRREKQQTNISEWEKLSQVRLGNPVPFHTIYIYSYSIYSLCSFPTNP